MAHALQRLATTLLPPARTGHLTAISIEQEAVPLQLTATAPAGSCPRCARPSSSVHSRYHRHLADLPWDRRRIEELARFARGPQDDLAALTAGLSLARSRGVTEGQIHRLKLLKRQGYGPAMPGTAGGNTTPY